MHDGSGRIVVQSLTKQFGAVTAVSNINFAVEPGTVTGFLGPNGAGKTTTLRAALGLITPTAGSALVNGVPYGDLTDPGRVLGAVLEAQGFHPRRSARNHLRVYAAAIGVPDTRADAVLNLVGLGAAGNRMPGGFSLGMRQRLALATALLGDPQILILDEPANGLDPEGVAWLRTFLRAFAQTGRTVLVSSHGLAEVEQTVDQLIIISRGLTVYNGSLADLRRTQQNKVLARPSDPAKLVTAMHEDNIFNIESTLDGWLIIGGVVSEQIADIALRAGISLYDIRTETPNLEQLYFALTQGQYTPAGYQPQTGYQPPGYQQTGYQQPVGYQAPGYQQQQYSEPVAQLPQQPNPWAQAGPQAQPEAQVQDEAPTPAQGTPLAAIQQEAALQAEAVTQHAAAPQAPAAPQASTTPRASTTPEASAHETATPQASAAPQSAVPATFAPETATPVASAPESPAQAAGAAAEAPAPAAGAAPDASAPEAAEAPQPSHAQQILAPSPLDLPAAPPPPETAPTSPPPPENPDNQEQSGSGGDAR
ncbi:MAG TPA: ATP-binding cassette domain-containing protein [Pseudonocardiaceae bacterium]